MKNKILLFALIITPISCGELFQDNEYYPLPEKYKTQLMELDTLIFENKDMYRDSFIVKNIIKGNMQLALSGISSKEPHAFHEFEYLMISRTNDSYNSFRYNNMISQSDGNYGEGTISLDTSCDYLIIGVIIGTRNLSEVTYEGAQKDYTPLINWYSQKYFDFKQYYDTIIIANKIYLDILEFTFDSGIVKIYYDYKKGIIKFIDSQYNEWVKIN